MIKLVAVFSALLVAACAHAEPAKNSAPEAADKSNGVSASGLIRHESAYTVDETVDRLEAALARRNIKVMAKVDHAKNAEGAGLELPATTLVIFGNPKAGTQLMLASRTSAIDLPMKALIYERGDNVYFEYNDIAYIAARHGIRDDMPVFAKIEALLSAIAIEATGN